MDPLHPQRRQQHESRCSTWTKWSESLVVRRGPKIGEQRMIMKCDQLYEIDAANGSKLSFATVLIALEEAHCSVRL